jgi:hypothetical protein
VKYSAPSGLHDDGVMALALAVKKFSAPKAFIGIAEPPNGEEQADPWEDWR